MQTSLTIGIIGAGALGGALGARLEGPRAQVLYWDVNRQLCTVESLDELVVNASIILVCTPSQTNRVIAREVAQVFPEGPGPAVISLAKGVEAGFKTMDQVLRAELGERFATGVISGPMLAGEVSAGLTAGATVATTDPAITGALADHFTRGGLIVQTSTDTTGVALAGSLKNIFALALGLSDGLKLGYNFKSALTVKALTDFQALLEHFGSDPALAFGMAGLGDLLTTGWSGASFNWRVGYNWAAGERASKGEGLNTLRELAKLVPVQRYPVVQALQAILLEEADPQTLAAVVSGNVLE